MHNPGNFEGGDVSPWPLLLSRRWFRSYRCILWLGSMGTKGSKAFYQENNYFWSNEIHHTCIINWGEYIVIMDISRKYRNCWFPISPMWENTWSIFSFSFIFMENLEIQINFIHTFPKFCQHTFGRRLYETNSLAFSWLVLKYGFHECIWLFTVSNMLVLNQWKNVWLNHFKILKNPS